MQIASEMISGNNTHDMLSMSEQLAESMAKVTTFVEQSMEEAGLLMNLTAQMNIVVDKIFSNISRYSGTTYATVGVKISNGCLTLRPVVHYDGAGSLGVLGD